MPQAPSYEANCSGKQESPQPPHNWTFHDRVRNRPLLDFVVHQTYTGHKLALFKKRYILILQIVSCARVEQS